MVSVKLEMTSGWTQIPVEGNVKVLSPGQELTFADKCERFNIYRINR